MDFAHRAPITVLNSGYRVLSSPLETEPQFKMNHQTGFFAKMRNATSGGSVFRRKHPSEGSLLEDRGQSAINVARRFTKRLKGEGRGLDRSQKKEGSGAVDGGGQ